MRCSTLVRSAGRHGTFARPSKDPVAGAVLSQSLAGAAALSRSLIRSRGTFAGSIEQWHSESQVPNPFLAKPPKSRVFRGLDLNQGDRFFQFAKMSMSLFPLVGLKGNLSLLDISQFDDWAHHSFPAGFSKWRSVSQKEQRWNFHQLSALESLFGSRKLTKTRATDNLGRHVDE